MISESLGSNIRCNDLGTDSIEMWKMWLDGCRGWLSESCSSVLGNNLSYLSDFDPVLACA